MRRDTTPVQDKASHSAHSLSIADALKDAALAALIAFGLFFFLIGLRSEGGPTGALQLSTRWPDLAMVVGAVFAGDFGRAMIAARCRPGRRARLRVRGGARHPCC